jgi:hypothetical protein
MIPQPAQTNFASPADADPLPHLTDADVPVPAGVRLDAAGALRKAAEVVYQTILEKRSA